MHRQVPCFCNVGHPYQGMVFQTSWRWGEPTAMEVKDRRKGTSPGSYPRDERRSFRLQITLPFHWETLARIFLSVTHLPFRSPIYLLHSFSNNKAQKPTAACGLPQRLNFGNSTAFFTIGFWRQSPSHGKAVLQSLAIPASHCCGSHNSVSLRDKDLPTCLAVYNLAREHHHTFNSCNHVLTCFYTVNSSNVSQKPLRLTHGMTIISSLPLSSLSLRIEWFSR